MSDDSPWQNVGTWNPGDSCDVLQLGDVLICNGGEHIKIYVGNDAVRQSYPDSDGNMHSASFGEYYPHISAEYTASNPLGRSFDIFQYE